MTKEKRFSIDGANGAIMSEKFKRAEAQETLTSKTESNRDKALRGEVVLVTKGRLREMQLQASALEGVGEGAYHWHWSAVLNELIARRSGALPAHETTGDAVSVTLTAAEFQALMSEKEKLTADLADADRINSESVNIRCALEHQLADQASHMNAVNAVLVSRIEQLREHARNACHVLAAGLSKEQADAIEAEVPPEEPADECDHPRSEFLARKGDAFEMRKCLQCTKIFRVRLPEKASGDDPTPEHLMKQGYRSGKVGDK